MNEVEPREEFVTLLGKYGALEYRYKDGDLQYASSIHGPWRRNENHRNTRGMWVVFWAWVDARAAEIGCVQNDKQPLVSPVDDVKVTLAINYSTLKTALDQIKHVLKEQNPSLEEIHELAMNALEDVQC